MELDKIFKKLKTLMPDAAYTHRSRHELIYEMQSGRKTKHGVFYVITQSMHVGSAVLVSGILIFLILGGFSGITAQPFTSSKTGFDFEGLKAEADAIDIQIQLTDVQPLKLQKRILEQETTTQSIFPKFIQKTLLKNEDESPLTEDILLDIKNESETSASIPSIEDILLRLSE